MSANEQPELVCADWLRQNGHGAHVPFLQACWADPLSDVPRLVYADWLDENGFAKRARFIRVQCAAARLEHDDVFVADERAFLEAEAWRLRPSVEAEWLGASQTSFSWKRGWTELSLVREPRANILDFVYKVPCASYYFRSSTNGCQFNTDYPGLSLAWSLDLDLRFMIDRNSIVRWLTEQPWLYLRTLQLGGEQRDVAAVLSGLARRFAPNELQRLHVYITKDRDGRADPLELSGWLNGPHAKLENLHLNAEQLSAISWQTFSTTLNLTNLRSITFEDTIFDGEEMRLLTANPHLQQLHTLKFKDCRIRTVASLADAPHWPRLQRLHIEAVGLDIPALTHGPLLGQLKQLELRNVQSAQLLRHLARHPGARQWQLLSLKKCCLTEAAFDVFAEGEWQLTHLDLSQGSVKWADFSLAMSGVGLSRLTHLDLSSNPQALTGRMVLAAATWWGQLEYLSLANTGLADFNLAQILKVADFRRLRYLDLSNNRLTSAAGKSLANCTTLTQLHTLKLSNNKLGDDGLAALAQLRCPKLRRLEVQENQINQRGAELFVHSPLLQHLTHLNLDRNTPQLDGLQALLRALESRPSIAFGNHGQID